MRLFGIPLFPEQASTIAKQVDALYFFLLAVTGFFALMIATLVVVFAVKYRRRSSDELPTPIHGSLGLELAWTLIPFGITMVIFVWGASVFFAIARPPDDALEVFVVGRQWMWKLQHLEGRREINELHVPLKRAVKLTMTSEDVIHSFYVPAFRVKSDVLPARYTTLWFEPTEVGTFHLFCAEYCGTAHARMIGRVVVMEPADYQAWLSGRGAAPLVGGPSMASAGEQLFEQLGCVTCHRHEHGALGPSLMGLFGSRVQLANGATVRADENYLRESIVNPQAKVVGGYRAVMPTFQGQIDEEQLLQLIQYIKTLGRADRGEAQKSSSPSGRGQVRG